MKPSKKIQKRLNRRLSDYTAMMASQNSAESKVAQRMETGGYTRPGSRQK